MKKIIVIIAALLIAPSAFAHPHERPDVEVLEPPAPYYPPIATLFGIQGICEVQVQISRGEEVHVTSVACSQPVFCYSARIAVSRSKMVARWEDGTPAEASNIIFPLRYSMDETQDERVQGTQLELCSERPVA